MCPVSRANPVPMHGFEYQERPLLGLMFTGTQIVEPPGQGKAVPFLATQMGNCMLYQTERFQDVQLHSQLKSKILTFPSSVMREARGCKAYRVAYLDHCSLGAGAQAP